MEVTLGQTVHKKSVVPPDLCYSRSLPTVPIDLCSARSVIEASLGRHKNLYAPARSVLDLNHDEASMNVRETIAMVDRWLDSDNWKPWTPPTFEEELRRLDDPDAPRPEIIDNEERHRQRVQIATTVPVRASIVSGRDVLDPTPIERTAVAIAQSIALETTHYANALHGSIGELRPGADDGSCKGGSTTTRIWHPIACRNPKNCSHCSLQ